MFAPPAGGGYEGGPRLSPPAPPMPPAMMVPAATSVAPAPVSPTTAGTAASATITAAIGCAMGGPFTIEVGFLVWKIAAALNGYRRHVRDSSFVVDFAAAFY